MAPHENPNSYVNRKSFHSVLLQAICDHRLLFTDAYAGEAGSIHDYTLFRRSPFYRGMNNGEIIFHNDSFLIGDSAYKLDMKLIVPVKNDRQLTRRELHFNRILSKLRVKIENAFAYLKGRFRRLKFVESTRLDIISLLIVSACILHNVCILEDDLPAEMINLNDEHREILNNPNNDPDLNEEIIMRRANTKRNNIINGLNIE